MSTHWIWLAGGVRTTTVAMAIALLVVGLARRRPVHGIVAVAAWVLGFEVAWQASQWAHGAAGLGEVEHWAIVAAGWLVAGWFAGLRPDWRFLPVVAAAWAAWWLTGFHSNLVDGRFDVFSELCNELAKMAWGAAYLLALLQLPRPETKEAPRPRWARGNVAEGRV